MTLEPKLVGVEAWMKEWTRKQTVIMSFLRLFSRFHITMSINHFEEPCFLDSSPPPTAFPSSDLRIWTKCPTFISADKHFSFWNYWAPAGRRSWWTVRRHHSFLAWTIAFRRFGVFSVALTLLLLFSRPVMSDFVWPHGLQRARSPGPSPSPEVCPSSCPLLR